MNAMNGPVRQSAGYTREASPLARICVTVSVFDVALLRRVVSDQTCAADGGQCVHGGFVVLQVTDVPYREDGHNGGHQNCVEDVEKNLVGNEVSAVTLEVFDDAEDAPDEDQGAGGVQGVKMPLPWDQVMLRRRCRCPRDSVMHGGRGEDEDTEYDDLDKEAGHDDLFAQLEHI